jgi:hypothetical protein
MNTIIEGDEVEKGLRKWDTVRSAAQEAIDRCRKAEEEVSFYKGQYEAIKTQCGSLTARNTQLMEENAEYKMLLSDLGRRFLDVLQNSKLAPFRPAGAKPGNGLGARAAREPLQRPQPLDGQTDELESSLKDIARQINLDKTRGV